MSIHESSLEVNTCKSKFQPHYLPAKSLVLNSALFFLSSPYFKNVQCDSEAASEIHLSFSKICVSGPRHEQVTACHLICGNCVHILGPQQM